MADHELRDSHNKLIGKIKQLSGGRFEGRDSHNKLKGHYDPKTDQTRDEHNKLVGKGNLLAILIAKP